MRSLLQIVAVVSLAGASNVYAANVVTDVVGGAVQLTGNAVAVVVPPVGNYVSDSAITGKVKSDILSCTCSSCISVTTNCGVVHLSGTVKDKEERDKLIKIAHNVCGVKSVDASGLTIGH